MQNYADDYTIIVTILFVLMSAISTLSYKLTKAHTQITRLQEESILLQEDCKEYGQEKSLLIQTIEEYQYQSNAKGQANYRIKKNIIKSIINQNKLTKQSNNKLVCVFNPVPTREKPQFQFTIINPERNDDITPYFGKEIPTTKVIPGNHNLRMLSMGLNDNYKENTIASHVLRNLYMTHPDKDPNKKYYDTETEMDKMVYETKILSPISHGYVLIYCDSNDHKEIIKLLNAFYLHITQEYLDDYKKR